MKSSDTCWPGARDRQGCLGAEPAGETDWQRTPPASHNTACNAEFAMDPWRWRRLVACSAFTCHLRAGTPFPPMPDP